jgi:predicted RNase H-like HicB family nuclease
MRGTQDSKIGSFGIAEEMGYSCQRICSMRKGLKRKTEMARIEIELEQEDDGRWIAEIPALPGVMVYGGSQEEASRLVEALALRVIAERLEHSEPIPEIVEEAFLVPA